MNDLTKIAALMAVLVTVLGCVAIVSDDSDAASETVYVGGANASDETGDGSQESPYATITKGISNTLPGGTVKLLGDVETAPFMVEKTRINIDLQDHTLKITGTSTSSGISFFGSSYQIQNGTIIDERDSTARAGGYTALFIGNAMELTLTDVEVKIYDSLNTSESNNAGIRAQGSTLTLVDSKITSIPGTDADSGSIGIVALGIGQENSVKVRLEGATTISVGQFGISGNGSMKTEDGTVVGGDDGVTGSTSADYRGTNISIGDDAIVEAKNGWGIYHPQDGTLTISDNAKVSGLTGIEMRSGTLELNGGTVESTATTFSSNANGSGPTTTGAAIAIVQHSIKLDIDVGIHDGVTVSGPTAVYQADLQNNGAEGTDKITIDIDGGDFTSTATGDNAKAVDVQDVTGFISGGSFTGSVSEESVQDGLEIGDDGSVTESPFVAMVDGNGYHTIDEAIRAAQDGDTIELVASGDVYVMTEHITPRNGNDVTIDLNGKTLDFGTEYRILATSQSGGITIRDGTLEFEHESPIQVYGCDLRFENCIIETTGIFPDSRYEWGPSIFSMFGYADADTTKSSTLYVGPDCEVIYGDTAEIGAYVVNIFDNNVNAAYGVSIDFQGRMTGNIGLAFYINGTVNKTEGGVPEIHIAMPDENKVSGGIYAAGYANWDIDSGYFESGTPLSIKSGSFDISGGIFHATGEFNDPADANGNGSEETGAALSITSNDGYAGNVKTVITGGTFTSDNGYAVYEGIAVDAEGDPAATASSAELEIQGGTFEGNSDKGDVAITEADNRNVITGGTFNTDVSEYAADGYVVIPNVDGSYGALESDVSDVTITGSGTYAYETDGSVITITVDDAYSDITLNLGFGDYSIVIVGDVTGDVTVACRPIDPEEMDGAVDIYISGVDDTDMAVTITIPVNVESGYHIDEDSVYAYSIVDGKPVSEEAYASGDAIVIETTHNTPFYVGYETESDLPPFIPFPPEQGGDPVEVYPSGDSGSSSDDGDGTLKVVAVAAAAVIAAILAIVLASTYRKD